MDREALPAWDDSGEGFVLPENWVWRNIGFVHSRYSLVAMPFEGKWKLYISRPEMYDTAPDAFRAAQKWLDENGENND
jgi:hypothetical protein